MSFLWVLAVVLLLQSFFEKKGNRMFNSESVIEIFQRRLLPFMPSGVITLTSAVSDVNGIVFTIDTFLGKIP